MKRDRAPKNRKRQKWVMTVPAAVVLCIMAVFSALADEPPQLDGLTYETKTDFHYAQGIDIFYYEGGYKYFDMHDSDQYLLVPEGGKVPENLDRKVTVIQAPVDRIYLAATASMALINAIDALDHIRMSSIAANSWYVEEAAQAMEAGDILFAGKYGEPDYELLLQEGCDLAVESTMILHTPKVQEMIEMLGIPVFIDRASYEEHPMGRPEWVKVYGALLGKEEEAAAFFEKQDEIMRELEDFPDTGKTVAFFYLHSGGSVMVRSNDDYVPKMIEMAGGEYALRDVKLLQETGRSTVPVSMEEFYHVAADADYLVYNAAIDAPLTGIDDLLDRSPLFADFKAVQEGNVWCTDRYLYQATDIVGDLIRDFHHMLTDGDEEQMTFLEKVR